MNPLRSSPDLWKHLPFDAMIEILSKLTIPDFIRFGAVCRSWASAFKSKIFHPNPNQTPWLMLPAQLSDQGTIAKFFDLSTQTSFSIELPGDPPIRRRLCMGSSHGWLATVDDQLEIILLNPITQSQIRLPPISTIMQLPPHSSPEEIYEKFVLSSSPMEKDCVVMLLIRLELYFARVGDRSWSKVPLSTDYTMFNEHPLFYDAIYHNKKFYIVDEHGLVHAWDPECSNGMVSKPTLFLKGPKCRNYFLYNKYLVLPPRGSFLQIWRLEVPDDAENHYCTEEFRVFQWDEGLLEWIELRSLGDYALFIGSNRSMCISSRDVPGVRANCIYFTEDFVDTRWGPCFESKRRDVGTCSLEDGSMERFFTSDYAQLNWPPPIWITPSLF